LADSVISIGCTASVLPQSHASHQEAALTGRSTRRPTTRPAATASPDPPPVTPTGPTCCAAPVPPSAPSAPSGYSIPLPPLFQFFYSVTPVTAFLSQGPPSAIMPVAPLPVNAAAGSLPVRILPVHALLNQLCWLMHTELACSFGNVLCKSCTCITLPCAPTPLMRCVCAAVDAGARHRQRVPDASRVAGPAGPACAVGASPCKLKCSALCSAPPVAD